MSKNEKLFELFPPVDTKEWMDKISADLKGADFNKKLVWKTKEGIEVLPFYREEDLQDLKYLNSMPGDYPWLRGIKTGNNSWKIRQNITITDYREANRKALQLLMKGIDSLGFMISDVESISDSNLEILLKDIVPGAVELNFLSNGKAKEIALFFHEWIKKGSTDMQKISGAVEADPLGRLLINGTLCIPVEQGFNYLASVAGSLSSLPSFRAIHLNASYFGDAGADIVQEIGLGLSMGTEYITQLTDRGIDAATALSKIRFSFGIGPEYFLQIAKLRAARLLWSVIASGFSPERKDTSRMDIHCVTSRWNKTFFDPYVNMLRTQTEAMSAILGGTDSLTVEAFDIVFREPTEFSERIARNQQIILKEESYFDKVADPGAGSYYIEKLTNLLAGNAWKLFLEVEEKGGFLRAFREGFIGKLIEVSAGKRKADVSSRRTTFLGTSRFPDPNEKPVADPDLKKLFPGKTTGKDLIAEPIRIFRGPASFEELRFDVEMAPVRPSVFVFPIGNPSMRKARALFSIDFFGCAGYRINNNPGFETVEEGVKKVLESKPEIVVICSSDDEYSKYAPVIHDLLKESALIVVAGNPKSIDDLKSKGIEYFISIRSDVVSTLKNFNRKLGIIPKLPESTDETKV